MVITKGSDHMDLFDLFAKISLDTSEYDSGVTSASQKFQELGKSLSAAGGTLTKAVTLPVAGLGTAIIKTGADYEARMSKVQAISGATAEEIAMLGDEAMRMASKTKFSTSESAEAYQYMAMAGWDAQQMVGGLSGIMLLASASGEGLASTSDIVTDALTAFGLKAEDSGRFADVLAAASNSANTNVSMLGESFKYVAPVAGAMGYSVEDISVALGLMANSGIKASQAGTTLRTAITNMASPTSNMVKVMDEYGISLTDADGNMLSLAEIMNILREKMGGLDEATQASAAATLFGKEAMSGMLAIINAAPEDFDKLTEAINNSAGTTEEMASIMQDNAAGAFERLKSAVNVLFTQLSEFLIPAFTAIVEKATEVINWFGQLDSGTQQLILTIAGISAAVGPVLIVVGKIVTAIGSIVSGIGGLIGAVGKAGSAISSLFAILAANPIALVIAAVAALTAGILVLWNTNEDFRNAVGAIWDAITGFFKAAWDTVQTLWGAAADFFKGVVDGIKGAFDGIGEFLGGLFTAAWELVKEAWDAAKGFFSEIADGIRAVFETMTSFLGEAFSAAWSAITAVWDASVSFFGGIWDAISGAASTAADLIGGVLAEAWGAVTSVWDGAVSFFGGIWDGIKGVFSDVWEHFLDIGGNIVNGIKDGIARAWNAFMGWLDSKVGGIVSGVKSMLGIHSPSTVFAGIGENMALGLAEGWEDQYTSIKRQIENGMNFGTATVGLSTAGLATGNASSVQDGQPTNRGGDTFIFNSPKALDPVSAAREMKKAKQQMALGYV